MALTEQQKQTKRNYYHNVEKLSQEYRAKRQANWERYTSNPLNIEKIRESNNTRVQADKLIDPLKYLIWGCKRRARLKGLECTIQPSDFVFTGKCAILGIPIFFHRGKVQDDSVSLDRIDNDKGYVPGNVMLVSHKANRLKSDASLEEIEMIASYIRANNPKYNNQ